MLEAIQDARGDNVLYIGKLFWVGEMSRVIVKTAVTMNTCLVVEGDGRV